MTTTTTVWPEPEHVTDGSWIIDYLYFLLANYSSKNSTGPLKIQFDQGQLWTQDDTYIIPKDPQGDEGFYLGFGSGMEIEGLGPDVKNYLVAVQQSELPFLKNRKNGTPYALLQDAGNNTWTSSCYYYDDTTNAIDQGIVMKNPPGYDKQTHKYDNKFYPLQFKSSNVNAGMLLVEEFLASNEGMPYVKNCCYSPTAPFFTSPYNEQFCRSPGIRLLGEGKDRCDLKNNNYCLSLDMTLSANPDPWCTCYSGAHPSPLNTLIQDWVAEQEPALKDAIAEQSKSLKALKEGDAACETREELQKLQPAFQTSTEEVYKTTIVSPICYIPGCSVKAYKNGDMTKSSGGENPCPSLCANIINTDDQGFARTDIHGVCQEIDCSGGVMPQAKQAPPGTCTDSPSYPPGTAGPSYPPGTRPPSKKINWVLYGGIGGAVILMLILLYFFI